MTGVLIEHDPSPMKLEVLSVEDWPLQSDPVGRSERNYSRTETSFVIAGEGLLQEPGEKAVPVGAGDLVTIMPDTICTWTITKAIERHYSKG